LQPLAERGVPRQVADGQRDGIAADGDVRAEPVTRLDRHIHEDLGGRDELVPDVVGGLSARGAVGGRPGLFQMVSRVAAETDPEG
jgi:hypothetical protein